MTDIIFFEAEQKRIYTELKQFKEQGKKIFASSSFQSQSLVLLHLISQTHPDIPIYFLNTGYHFADTLKFKDRLSQQFNLNVIDLVPDTPKSHQKDSDGRLLYASDPDFCCHLNKIVPMEPVLMRYDVWVSGIRKAQSAHRQTMHPTQKGKHGVLRYHPILDWSTKQAYAYRKLHQLPAHPLEASGYLSIGCQPCTRRVDLSNPAQDNRTGRWFGTNKTECGLHTQLTEK